MTKIYSLLIAGWCLLTTTLLPAQNVNLELKITRLERTSYTDCNGCGDPDPSWIIRASNNSSNPLVYGPYCWHYAEMGFALWDIPDYTVMNLINSNATNFSLGFADAFEKSCDNNYCTYESYNFFTCFPSVYGDSRRCQSPQLVTENFRTYSPCQWHTAWSSWCGDYRFEYSFYWSFNYAPTLVTQPAVSTQLCMGDTTQLTVAAGSDPYGWNMGQNFQWQTSVSTACPGNNWVDIPGANIAAFTPPQIPGTRLYRCKVTSNCNPNFATNFTLSNCSVVTYNPMGSPGDLPPDIVSGICGSTVLPGSTHLLGVLTPPNPGAVLGLTGYTWTANGGSPLTYNGANFTWTAPVNPGTYSIGVTYNDNCPQPDAVSNVCVVNVGSPTCDFAYVSTYGVDSTYAGGPDNPYHTLAYALTQLNGRKYIRVATGVYTESVPLNLITDLVIEGGYKVTGNIWSKTNADSTVIIGDGIEVVNNDVAHRVGFKSNGASNWTLQDLIIRTNNISQTTNSRKGYSNYGLLVLNGSSNFNIVRCKLYAGTAANGDNGVVPAGSGGAGGGGNGGAGGGGSTSGCGGQGNAGSAGLPGNGGASGGNGGGSCGGGGCNIFGCNASGCTASSGGAGSVGAAGSGYAAGVRPPTPPVASPYYIPDGQAGSGSAGFGGGGGGGGGGGDIGTCCTCTCGSGSPNGGTGGHGGGGGVGGVGGYGGGGSFGIYASGAGTSGNIVTSLVIAGSAGLGGNGSAGQPGGSGANGIAGVNHGGCDGGAGGTGGPGGAGGAGGRGQDGANGLSLAIATVGGATINGSSTGVPNAYIVGINNDNAKLCINSEIGLTKSSGVWTFPSGLNFENDQRDYPAGFPISSYNASASPTVVYTTTPSVTYDLTVNGSIYAQYLHIASDNRLLPSIQIASHVICIDGTDSLSATHWGTEMEYDWRIYTGTNVNNPLFQSTLPAPSVNFYGFAPGLYNVRYRVRENCCGWSKAVFDTIRIMPQPTLFSVSGGGNYCPGTNGQNIVLSGSEPGVTYILLYNGTPVDSMTGTGSPLTFTAQSGVGNYTVLAVRFGGCDNTMLGTASIGQFPQPQVFDVSGSDTLCAQGGATAATITLSGSELGVQYQLIKNATQPIGPPLPGTALPLSFTNITAQGIYTVMATNTNTGCQSMMNDSALVLIAPPPAVFQVTGGGAFCEGTGGVVIGLDSSELGTTYQLLQGGVLPAALPVSGTGNAFSFPAVDVPGYYKIKAISSYGCESWMNDSAWVSKLAPPSLTGVVVTDALCDGSASGSIVIHATTTNGTVVYSIDSAATFSATSAFNSLSAGPYYIVVKDDSGCLARYAANPVEVASPLALNLLVQGNDPDCYGNLTGSATALVSGGTSPYTYSWSTAPPQSGFSINHLSGGQSYTVTVQDANGCETSGTVQLQQPAELLVTLHPGNIRCFGGDDGNVAIAVTGGAPPYSYYLNGAFQTDSVYSGLTAGTYTVIVQDNHGCHTSTTFTVTQPQAFSVNAGADVVALHGQVVQLNAQASSAHGILSYLWSPDVELSCTACQQTNARPDTTLTYLLTVVDGDSCYNFDSVTIYVKYATDYFIPTAFTPNGDNLNDYFDVDILGAQHIETSIFNRWGELVYFNADQPNGNSNGNAWNGTKDGKKLPADTYVYQFKVQFFDGTEKTLSGTIVLMR